MVRMRELDFLKAMNRTSEFWATGVSPRGSFVPDAGQITWEYRFCDMDELPSKAQGVTAGGWTVVSSSTRRDKRREYLLKRPRR